MRAKTILLNLLFTAFILTSCSAVTPDGLEFTGGQRIISPGRTAELIIVPHYPEDSSGTDSQRATKTSAPSFSGEPQLSSDNPDIKILSVKTETISPAISCTIVVSASESMLSGESARITISWGGFSSESLIKIKKQPSLYIDESGVITDAEATDALINKNRELPSDYIPSDLVRVKVPTILIFEEVNHLRKPASAALSSMFRAAEEEEGFILTARSGYRSYSTQVMLFDANVSTHGMEYAAKFSAKPGTSEHQSGLAMDITAEIMNYQLEQSFGKTPEGRWTAQNAHRFGFIIRYPEGSEEITGYAYEPWHLRYIGEKLAAEIYHGGLTLEEYYSGQNLRSHT
ncbi:MAG: M15 family metallopeptidase [Spirochaetales bacterium]|nr:M15 family metallopeptidase [Spirochaetales bacterium]